MKKIIFISLLSLISTNQMNSQEEKPPKSEKLFNSTIRIECSGDTIIGGKKQRFTSVGTGFFFEYIIDGESIPVIVTNYHVIKNTDLGILNFLELGKDGPKYQTNIKESISQFEDKWIKHPTADLAILLLNPIKTSIFQKTKKNVSTQFFTEFILPGDRLLEEITAIEEVLMVGYPKGFWDKTNNIPVIRKGITATPFFLDYEGRKEFLLDIPIFSGSSGSPIVLFNQGSYYTREGGLKVGTRISFLGINAQSVDYLAEGQLILPPKNPTIKTTTKTSLNIAVIIKSEELLAFRPILKKMLISND